MKKTLIVLFLLAAPLLAVTLNITVPGSAIPKAQEMCEELRNEIRVRSSDWSNDLCATIFTRIGIRVYVARVERRGQQQIVDDAVQDEIDLFDTNWPAPFTRAVCGDGILDTEFGEECDDGGTEQGDGCDHRCQIEP